MLKFTLVYRKGSVGASGDLAPLAHMCLPLAEGEVRYHGEIMPAEKACLAVTADNLGCQGLRC